MTPKEFLEYHKYNFNRAMHNISIGEQWSAFGILWEDAQKQPWFDDFVDKGIGYRPFVDYGLYHIFIEMHNVKPVKFAAKLKDFLETLNGEIHLDELADQGNARRAAHGGSGILPAKEETGRAA